MPSIAPMQHSGPCPICKSNGKLVPFDPPGVGRKALICQLCRKHNAVQVDVFAWFAWSAGSSGAGRMSGLTTYNGKTYIGWDEWYAAYGEQVTAEMNRRKGYNHRHELLEWDRLRGLYGSEEAHRMYEAMHK